MASLTIQRSGWFKDIKRLPSSLRGIYTSDHAVHTFAENGDFRVNSLPYPI
jgi:hypothetical protein